MPSRRLPPRGLPAQPYTAEESVILMYFLSRGMYFHVIVDVIHYITGSERTTNGLGSLALRIRRDELETCPFDLYDNASNTWSLELVDYWLVLTQSQPFPLSLLMLWFRGRT